MIKIARIFVSRPSLAAQTCRTLSVSQLYNVALPSLTADRIKFVRDNRFNTLRDQDVAYLEKLLGATNVFLRSRDDDTSKYNTDWLRMYRGNAAAVLRPGDVSQLSNLMKYCNDRRLAIVPQGGNTSLSGGAVPIFDEIVVSLERMNRVESFEDLSGVAVVQAGCVLEKLDQHLAERGFMVPLDLGSKGSCQIGGNVSTNAGGLRLLRYGSLHGNVLGLEVVLADGTILNMLNTLRKDNTGYDMKQLFIGAEGTLGIISKIALLAVPRPKVSQVAYLSCDSFEQVLNVFRQAKHELCEIMSAFEFMDNQSMHVSLRHHSKHGVRHPFGQDWHDRVINNGESDSPFYIIIETSGSNREHDDEKLSAFLSWALEKAGCTNGVVSQDFTQFRTLWKVRESMMIAALDFFPQDDCPLFFNYDISITQSKMYKLVEDTRGFLSKQNLKQLGIQRPPFTVGYGHLGDGNLHLNVLTERYTQTQEHLFDKFVYSWASKNGGSASAEHGIGFTKMPYLPQLKSAAVYGAMKNLKALLDPHGILNPYKMTDFR